jgi:hypothetical protein
MSESDETDARLSIWRVERVWIADRAREALEAEGRRASEGRVIVVRLYETPYGKAHMSIARDMEEIYLGLGE